jgi:hypothetical protein
MRASGARFVRTGLIAALFCFSLLLSLPHAPGIVSAASTALQLYGQCAPPQQGVTICVRSVDPYEPQDPANTVSPFQVIAAGTSGRGRVDNMQLWADGKKVMQTPGSPFDQAVTLPQGLHELTVIEVDETGFYAKSTSLMVNVQSVSPGPPCAPPDSPGVHICHYDQAPCDPWIDVSAAGRGEWRCG